MRVRFIERFDYRPTPGSVVAYKAGWEGRVPREAAAQALAAGKAVEIGSARRPATAEGE